ncbi:hypothetical protein PIB30_093091 [Stylosanthes scabra]|uniref:Uncharacterized protein n=1 Tax=Stylosanthes scabra TaxID=79078 RepID=A0ABU6UXI7_9FABA|nr:hypothetical protein [Stylosanthes scabra]
MSARNKTTLCRFHQLFHNVAEMPREVFCNHLIRYIAKTDWSHMFQTRDRFNFRDKSDEGVIDISNLSWIIKDVLNKVAVIFSHFIPFVLVEKSMNYVTYRGFKSPHIEEKAIRDPLQTTKKSCLFLVDVPKHIFVRRLQRILEETDPFSPGVLNIPIDTQQVVKIRMIKPSRQETKKVFDTCLEEQRAIAGDIRVNDRI